MPGLRVHRVYQIKEGKNEEARQWVVDVTKYVREHWPDIDFLFFVDQSRPDSSYHVMADYKSFVHMGETVSGADEEFLTIWNRQSACMEEAVTQTYLLRVEVD